MIGDILKKILICIVKIWSKIYSYRFSQLLDDYKSIVYTIWLSRALGSVDRTCTIRYPIKIQGGGERNINIGEGTSIGKFSVLGCWKNYNGQDGLEPEITIGNNCNIGEFCHITSINRVCIGNGLLTGRFVYIGDNTHGGLSWEEANTPPAKRKLYSKGGITIGNNVWIGDKVTILGGVTIGDNVIVGSNSVVNHDILSNCVAAGAPAKIIKQL